VCVLACKTPLRPLHFYKIAQILPGGGGDCADFQSRQNELIAHRGAGLLNGSGGQFEYGMGAQTERKPPGRDCGACLQYRAIAAQEENVDGKFHADGVHALGGHDPKALAGCKSAMLQQSGSPGGAGIRNGGAIRQQCPGSRV